MSIKFKFFTALKSICHEITHWVLHWMYFYWFYNEIFNFSLKITKKHQCVVYDCILKGFRQPVLGHFSIDLEKFIKQTRERMKKKLKKYAEQQKEKNEAFAQISNLIQQTEPPTKKPISPNKDVNIQEIELTSEKDQTIKEPLLKEISRKGDSPKKFETNLMEFEVITQ